MERYSLITEKFPREFVLLQGQGCRWRRCEFCDYHTDVSANPWKVNQKVLEQVTGCYGVLDVINSGSALELDEQTLAFIEHLVREKNIQTLWFEMHYMYRNQLRKFAERFYPAKVKFRCGIESFDPVLRAKWNKGVPATVLPQDVARFFDGVCLLCCTVGDSKERILSDVEQAKLLFEYTSVNVFCNNTTSVKRDDELANWFASDLLPILQNDPLIEVLLENTDLGVG